MRAIILAAGEGTRLRPHTLSVPKCMVNLAGKPLLEYQLAALRLVGIEDIVMVGGYRRESLPTDGIRHYVNPLYASTNMVCSLFCAEVELDTDVIIAYSDIVYHPNILAALLSSPHPLAVTVDLEWRRLWDLRMHDPLSDAESLVMTPEGRVLELGKKTNSYERIQGQYMGLIKMDKSVLPAVRSHYHALDRHARYDGRDFQNMFMTSFLQGLIDSGLAVHAAPVHGGWLEVDTLEDLDIYETQGLGALGVLGTDARSLPVGER